MLTVVTHHIKMPDEWQALLRPHLPGIGDGNTMDWIRMLGDSARWIAPGARLVLLTDKTTRVDRDLAWDVRRDDFPMRGVNHHRMQARVRFCETAPEGRYIFCDADVLLNRLPDMDWDMGITVRLAPATENNGGLKVQEGVMYAGNIKCALDYFRAILDRHENGNADERFDWGGTQVAAQGLLFPHAMRDGKVLQQFTWDGWRFRLLPWRKYNWTPYGDDDGSLAFAWHFKGNRKHLMPSYYDNLRDRHDDRLRKHAEGHQEHGRRATEGIV